MNSAMRMIGLGVGILTLIVVSPIHAQTNSDRFLNDSHVFRRILFEHQFQPLSTFDAIWKDPNHTLLVILGPVRGDFFSTSLQTGIEAKAAGIQTPRIEEPLKTFLQKGGAILYASDHDLTPDQSPFARDLDNLTGFRIDGTIFDMSASQDQFFYRNPSCPVLEAVPGARPDLLALPDLPNGQKLPVATNRPSRLIRSKTIDSNLVRSLLLLPEMIGSGREMIPGKRSPFVGQHLKNDQENRRKAFFPPEERTFGVVYEGNKSRCKLLLLADHSIFINSMMLPTDNANVEFASKCIGYLREQGAELRNRVLLIEDGLVNPNLDIPLKSVTVPNSPDLNQSAVEAILGSLNDRLASLEDQNAFDTGINQWMQSRNITPRSLTFSVLVLISIVLGAWVLIQILRTRKNRIEQLVEPQPRVKPVPMAFENLLQHRHHELVRKGNLWETARSITRNLWDEFPMRIPANHNQTPRFEVTGSFWERWQKRRRARYYWKLAYAPTTQRVRPAAWTRFLAEIERLRVDLRDGTVQVRPQA